MAADIDIVVSVRDASKAGFNAAKRGLKEVKTQATSTSASFKGLYGEIAKIAAILGVGAFIKNSISTFKEFDDTMRQVGAVTGATASELDLLTQTAKRMGATTRFSASEAADGLRLLGMAGFEAVEATQALPGVLNLAAAGSIDLGTAADIATNVLAGFGLEIEQLGQVNDVLVKTFTSSNTTLYELGEGFKLVGPIAKGVGADFEDLVASIGKLGDAGLKGTLAGTSLRGAINALLNPTNEEAKLMADLSKRIGGVGLQVKDAEGNFVGFAKIIEQLEAAGLKGDEALKLFGQRAGPGIAALMQVGSETLREFSDELRISGGTADQVATQMEAGIGGASRELVAATEGIMIALGDAFSENLIDIISGIRDIVISLTDKIKELQQDGTIALWGEMAKSVLAALTITIQALVAIVTDAARNIVIFGLAITGIVTGDFKPAIEAMKDFGKSTKDFVKGLTEARAEAEGGLRFKIDAETGEVTKVLDAAGKEIEYSVEPSGPIGKGTEKLKKAIDEALAGPSYTATLKSALLKLNQELASESAQIEGEYDQGLINLDRYFSQRESIVKRRIEAELEVLRLAASEESDVDKKEIINAKITAKEEELNTKLIQLANEKAKEIEKVENGIQSKREALARKQLTAEKALADQRQRLAEFGSAGGLEAVFNKELTDLQTKHASELVAIQEFHEAELALLREKNASKLDIDKAYEEQKAQIEEQARLQQAEKIALANDQEKRLAEFRLQTLADTASAVSDILTNVYELTGKKNKELFYLAKAAAIAEATINIAQGITKAMAQGGLLGITQGATIAAAGAVQIATIASQGLAEGGIVAGKSPSSTADDKLIRATSGEYVHNVAATKYYGRDVMDTINSMSIGKGVLRSALGLSTRNFSFPPLRHSLNRFQGGGEIASPNQQQVANREQSQTPNIINVLDPSVFEQWSQSSAGQRNILNVISANSFEVKKIVLGNG